MAASNAKSSTGKGGRPRVLRQTEGSARKAVEKLKDTPKPGLNVRFARQMRAHQGKLGLGPGPGEEVFAASFLREREIVLDEELLRHAPDLVRIFAHELYHFVWRRLPNSERAAWAEVLKQEQVPLHPDLSSRLAFDRYRDKPTEANWKHYVCEAFCDSASAFASPDALLRSNRKRWLASLMKRRPLAV